jgi:hypothetical protein
MVGMLCPPDLPLPDIPTLMISGSHCCQRWSRCEVWKASRRLRKQDAQSKGHRFLILRRNKACLHKDDLLHSTHIRIIPTPRRPLRSFPLLLIPPYIRALDRILPFRLILSQNQTTPSFELSLGSSGFGIGYGINCPSRVILEVFLEVNCLFACCGRCGDGGADERGVAA